VNSSKIGVSQLLLFLAKYYEYDQIKEKRDRLGMQNEKQCTNLYFKFIPKALWPNKNERTKEEAEIYTRQHNCVS
jgi:hypothetical protein